MAILVIANSQLSLLLPCSIVFWVETGYPSSKVRNSHSIKFLFEATWSNRVHGSGVLQCVLDVVSRHIRWAYDLVLWTETSKHALHQLLEYKPYEAKWKGGNAFKHLLDLEQEYSQYYF